MSGRPDGTRRLFPLLPPVASAAAASVRLVRRRCVDQLKVATCLCRP